MHEHRALGQTLRHDHPGGALPHGYFEHPEDGSRATDVASIAPVADALAAVDVAQGWAVASEVDGTRSELEALRALAEAVRVSLVAYSETDVRALASAAMELWNTADRPDENRILSASQRTALGKADAMFGGGS